VSFAQPYLLAALLVLPLLFVIRWRRRGGSPSATFSDLSLFASSHATWRLRYRWLPTAIGALAIALLVIAVARPRSGQADSEQPGQGIDIALVIDTSGSMVTTFANEQTRLAVAQNVLTDFISSRENDQIALVVFRSTSLVLSPLTLDYDALTALVARVDQINLNDGTAIGVGLGDALNLLRESRSRSRVAILLTDGENNGGAVEPLAAARIAETLGIRVYTIGLIDPGSRGRGDVNVDERALQEMAQVTGGRYFPAESKAALSQIYDSIDRLEKSRVGKPQFGNYDELAPYFIAAGLVLLMMELSLNATVWKRA
jgi:Ca-activated chloride channel family protein